MKTTAVVAGVLACAALLAVAAVATSRQDAGAQLPALAGVSAGMHFTDADGNARLPTAEERAALAEAFQADLASLTRNRRIPSGSSRAPSGAEMAVVGADRLRFLTATVDEGGQVRLDHAGIDDDGKPVESPANTLPEM